jgi:hypothetical protein
LSNPKKIELALLSKNYTEEETNELNDKLIDYGIDNYTCFKHNSDNINFKK